MLICRITFEPLKNRGLYGLLQVLLCFIYLSFKQCIKVSINSIQKHWMWHFSKALWIKVECLHFSVILTVWFKSHCAKCIEAKVQEVPLSKNPCTYSKCISVKIDQFGGKKRVNNWKKACNVNKCPFVLLDIRIEIYFKSCQRSKI